MSIASSDSDNDINVQNNKNTNSVRCASVDKDDEFEEETISEKLNNLLSSDSSDAEGSEGEEENIIELDETGCVHDFNIIADALEHRKVENKTFNDLELRDIDRKNSILMSKILSHTKRPSQYKVEPLFTKTSSSSINRKKAQRQIDQDNMRLLKKIQSVKPFGLSRSKK